MPLSYLIWSLCRMSAGPGIGALSSFLLGHPLAGFIPSMDLGLPIWEETTSLQGCGKKMS